MVLAGPSSPPQKHYCSTTAYNGARVRPIPTVTVGTRDSTKGLRMRPIHTLLRVALIASLAQPALLSADTAPARFQGRPTFSEGDALGYFIWQDGETWKVRWTTFGAEHRFSGRVTIEGGQLRDFKRVDADTERRVIAPGRPARVVRGPGGRVRRVAPGRGAVVATREEDRIDQETERVIQFVARTDDDIDGFDFKTTESTDLIRFVLQIDGQTKPDEIEVGRSNFKPGEDPLVVRLR